MVQGLDPSHSQLATQFEHGPLHFSLHFPSSLSFDGKKRIVDTECFNRLAPKCAKEVNVVKRKRCLQMCLDIYAPRIVIKEI